MAIVNPVIENASKVIREGFQRMTQAQGKGTAWTPDVSKRAGVYMLYSEGADRYFIGYASNLINTVMTKASGIVKGDSGNADFDKAIRLDARFQIWVMPMDSLDVAKVHGDVMIKRFKPSGILFNIRGNVKGNIIETGYVEKPKVGQKVISLEPKQGSLEAAAESKGQKHIGGGSADPDYSVAFKAQMDKQKLPAIETFPTKPAVDLNAGRRPSAMRSLRDVARAIFDGHESIEDIKDRVQRRKVQELLDQMIVVPPVSNVADGASAVERLQGALGGETDAPYVTVEGVEYRGMQAAVIGSGYSRETITARTSDMGLLWQEWHIETVEARAKRVADGVHPYVKPLLKHLRRSGSMSAVVKPIDRSTSEIITETVVTATNPVVEAPVVTLMEATEQVKTIIETTPAIMEIPAPKPAVIPQISETIMMVAATLDVDALLAALTAEQVTQLFPKVGEHLRMGYSLVGAVSGGNEALFELEVPVHLMPYVLLREHLTRLRVFGRETTPLDNARWLIDNMLVNLPEVPTLVDLPTLNVAFEWNGPYGTAYLECLAESYHFYTRPSDRTVVPAFLFGAAPDVKVSDALTALFKSV